MRRRGSTSTDWSSQSRSRSACCRCSAAGRATEPPLSCCRGHLRGGRCGARSDLGAHIDGFIATEATTVVVQSDAATPVTGAVSRLRLHEPPEWQGAGGPWGRASGRCCRMTQLRWDAWRTWQSHLPGRQRLKRRCSGCAGRAADVVSAAAAAMEAALRLIRPGRKISDVAEPLGKVGARAVRETGKGCSGK